MILAAAAALCMMFCTAAQCADGPKPPEQPAKGPGSTEYHHASVKETSLGSGDTEVWIFEPAGPAPESAPVIIFLHGWGAMNPAGYKGWIDHLARRGNIVIYPRYQGTLLTRPETMTGNAVKAVRDALAELRKPGHVTPDVAKVATVGHSLGGVLAVNLAAIAKAEGLPQPTAVMSVEPGDSKNSRIAERLGWHAKSVVGDYSTVPTGTLFLIVLGDEDFMVGEATAEKIWAGLKHLPRADRDFVTVVSDRRGTPALVANHYFPAAADPRLKWQGPGAIDALDFFGTWKLLDGLTDAAFHGKNREFALGNTAEQRFMGKWSDGTPVKELKVREE